MKIIRQAEICAGKLRREQDLKDAVDIVLRHLREDPQYIQTAEHTPEGIASWFERKRIDALWFAEIDTVWVGVVALRRQHFTSIDVEPVPNVELCRLMVAPEARGQKVARELVFAALAATEGDRPWLSVLEGSPAHRMYQRWGWENIGRVESADDPLDEIIAMTLP